MSRFVTQVCRRGLLPAVLPLVFAGVAHADEVTDWHEHLFTALGNAGTSPLVSTREAALVSAAVFDAVNGVERRYDPVHVAAEAPRGTSKRAAAVQAAYAVLVARFPAQAADLAGKRLASLADIAEAGKGQALERGVEWGDEVAAAILAWRSTDGFVPAPGPYLGSTDVGRWRPTPPGNLPGAGPQFATMTPWGVAAADAVRPP